MDMIQNAVDTNNSRLEAAIDYQNQQISRITYLLTQFFSNYAYTEHKTVLSVNGRELSAAIAPDMNRELTKILFKNDRGR